LQAAADLQSAFLARLSQLVRVCGENRRLGGRKSLLINKTFSYARVVQTYPLFRL
jgi:hypothetical protein